MILRRMFTYFMWLELPIVGVLAGLSIISERFFIPAILTGVTFRFLALINRQGIIPSSLRSKGAAAFGLLLCLPLSLWVSPIPEESRSQALRLVTGLVLFIASAEWASRPERWKLLLPAWVLLGLFVSAAGLGVLDWKMTQLVLIPSALISNIPRIPGELINPNVLAGSMVLLLPGAFAAILFSTKKTLWTLPISLLILLFQAAVLINTQSRGAWVAGACAFCLIFILRWPRWTWAVVIPAMIAAVRFLFANPEWALLQLETGGLSGDHASRLEIWRSAIYLLRDMPITGVGPGAFSTTAQLIYPFTASNPLNAHAHNIFLQIALDLGIPGLTFWLATVIAACAGAWQAYRSNSPLIRCVGAALLGGILSMLIHGFVDAVTWGLRPAPLAWALLGLAIAAGVIPTHIGEGGTYN